MIFGCGETFLIFSKTDCLLYVCTQWNQVLCRLLMFLQTILMCT